MPIFRRRLPAEQFWRWFVRNEDRLFQVEGGREPVLVELSRALHRVHPHLTFEFSPVEEGRREFVISADGLREAFPMVEALADARPAGLDRWDIIRFRPRRAQLMAIEVAGRPVHPDEFEFAILRSPSTGEIGLWIYVRGYTEPARDDWARIVFLLLDGALGEYDVATRVAAIEIKDFDEKCPGPRYPFRDLPSIFDVVYESADHASA